jgi:NAD(P)-dependent dehydrogenase (short-subunit alcohol dehydrogenase family)
MTMSERMQGKIVVVFGAGSSGPGWGNGKAAAVVYAREGAKVAAIDVDLAAAQETSDIIVSEGGAADVTRAVDIAAAISQVMGEWGRIDVLHNNVGITEMALVHELADEDWDRTFSVNARSMFLTCKSALPIMMAQNGGAIVNVSTVGSVRVSKVPLAAYNASKAAVNQLTKTIALQYGKSGIRANAVLPGLIDTPMVRRQLFDHYGDSIEELLVKRDANSPTGKAGTAWDVAYAALFLASDEAKFVNGVLLPVDGGTIAGMP